MGLPTTPEIAPTPATPVPSTLLAILQACVTGMKHPEIEEDLDASAFVAPSAGLVPGTPNVLGDNWTTGGFAISVGCPLRYPAGTRITTIVAHFANGTAGNTTTLDLNRKNLATGAVTNVATVNEATAGAIRSVTLTPDHVMEAGYAYTVRYRNNAAADATPIFYGASVKRDRL